MYNILHCKQLVLFKSTELIPSYFMLQLFDDTHNERIRAILNGSSNLVEVTDKLRNSNIKYNCIRLDEITHVAGYDPEKAE